MSSTVVQALFNPVHLFGPGHSIWFGPAEGDGLEGNPDQDDRVPILKKVKWQEAVFVNYHLIDERVVNGEEMLCRAKSSGQIRLGADVCMELLSDFIRRRQHSMLEHLCRTQDLDFVVFLGTVIRDPEGKRCVLCLHREDSAWHCRLVLLGTDDWATNMLSIVPRQW
jgi:hypothetical protein